MQPAVACGPACVSQPLRWAPRPDHWPGHWLVRWPSTKRSALLLLSPTRPLALVPPACLPEPPSPLLGLSLLLPFLLPPLPSQILPPPIGTTLSPPVSLPLPSGFLSFPSSPFSLFRLVISRISYLIILCHHRPTSLLSWTSAKPPPHTPAMSRQSRSQAGHSGHSSQAPARQNEYFVARDGIDREVISADICRYLGNDALVRPGVYEVCRSRLSPTRLSAHCLPSEPADRPGLQRLLHHRLQKLNHSEYLLLSTAWYAEFPLTSAGHDRGLEGRLLSLG